MADTDIFPPVPEVLVHTLERLFPNKCPELNASNRQVWYDAGAVSVVSFLRHCFEEQQKRPDAKNAEAPLPDLGLFSLSPLDQEY